MLSLRDFELRNFKTGAKAHCQGKHSGIAAMRHPG
jgi:hypothetical protein